MEIVYGGGKEGQMLGTHPLVSAIHLTGSDVTYNAIVWGPKNPKKVRISIPILFHEFLPVLLPALHPFCNSLPASHFASAGPMPLSLLHSTQPTPRHSLLPVFICEGTSICILSSFHPDVMCSNRHVLDISDCWHIKLLEWLCIKAASSAQIDTVCQLIV